MSLKICSLSPVKIEKQFSVKDEIKSWGRAFKILTLEIRSLINKIVKDQNQVEKLEHRIRHIEAKDHAYEIKKEYKESSIASIRNIAHENFFKNSAEYLNEIHHLQQQISKNSSSQILFDPNPWDKADPILKKETLVWKQTKNGICFGTTIELIKQLFQLDLSSPNFEQDLLKILRDFELGGGPIVVANQIAACCLNTFQRPADIMIGMLDRLQEGRIFSSLQRDMIELLLISVAPRLVIGNPDLVKKLSVEYQTQLCKQIRNKFGKKSLDVFTGFLAKLVNQSKISFLSHEIVNEKLKEAALGRGLNALNADRLSTVAKWTVNLIEYLNETQPKTLRVSRNIQPITDRLHFSFQLIVQKIKDKVSSLKTSYQSSSSLKKHNFIPLVKLQAMQVNEDTLSLPIEQVKRIEFKSMEPQLGLIGIQSDKDLLNQLNSLEIGIFELSFRIAQGGHSTLYVKSNTDSYFIDPNGFVLRCEDENNLLKVISSYSYPTKIEFGNLPRSHCIQLRKAVKTNLG